MTDQLLIDLIRQTGEIVFFLSAPLLLVGLVVGVGISILQVATSIQDSTLSFIPRVMAIGVVGFLSMPWMVRMMLAFTERLFSGFSLYLN